MLRHKLSLVFASALIVVGVSGALALVFFAEPVPATLLAAAGFVAALGAYWLWEDVLGPLILLRRRRDPTPPDRDSGADHSPRR
jgi:hypothetical protein